MIANAAENRTAGLEIWRELCGAPSDRPEKTEYILADKSNVPKCSRGCLRSTLTPCIKTCERVIAAPAVYKRALPLFIARMIKFRVDLKAACRDNLGEKQAQFARLVEDSLVSCLPAWAKEWSQLCGVALRNICEKLCVRVCERKCVPSCKLPCARVPIYRHHRNRTVVRRVIKCMRKCLLVCMAACKRACLILTKKWFWIKIKHMYRFILVDTARKLTDQWIEQDLIEERKQLTNKYNVLNGCKF